MSEGIPDWPRALGGAAGTAVLKAAPEDFRVTELMDVEPDGAGEFLWLDVEKRDQNTAWVAERLARWAGVRPRDVSHSGLKDRRAVARQWFSVHLPGRPDPDLESLEEPGVTVLYAKRHARKLRTGTHRGNRFEIVLRNFDGDADALAKRCQAAAGGVPNYFGPQRFGHGGDNLRQARALYAGQRRRSRHITSLLHSAARAFLFNQVLGQRVADGTWNRGIEGEIWMLAGTRSVFGPEPLTDEHIRRCAEGDIAPTGPLHGSGPSPGKSDQAALEADVMARHADLANGLVDHGLRGARRRLVLVPRAFEWSMDGPDLRLGFDLARGEYATSVLREVVES